LGLILLFEQFAVLLFNKSSQRKILDNGGCLGACAEQSDEELTTAETTILLAKQKWAS